MKVNILHVKHICMLSATEPTYSRGDHALEKVTPKSCGISILRDIQSCLDMVPDSLPQAALLKQQGRQDLQRSLPVSIILRYFAGPRDVVEAVSCHRTVTAHSCLVLI